MDSGAGITWTTCAVALGANVGDRAANIRGAVAMIEATEGVLGVRVSSLHETEPVGTIEQGMFLNAAIVFETTLDARGLLDRLHTIEREHGRQRDQEQRWGPRTLDLDLLLFGDAVIDEPGLCVPHPRMHERRFVLAPLAEVGPGLVVPGLGGSVSELLVAMPGEG